MIIHVGDKVRYRGSFGSGPVETVTVEGIETTPLGSREKYGHEAEMVDLTQNDACLDLSNGHWAYSDQIESVVA